MVRLRTMVGVLVSVATMAATMLVSAQTPRVGDSALKNAGKNGDWLGYGLDQAETRYSVLKQIDATNVRRLGLAWAYDLRSVGGGQAATPVVWNGTIYGVTNESIVFAVDARTGKEKWRWEPRDPGRGCCAPNRGVALYQNLVISATLEGRLFGLDIETGRPVWETRVAVAADGYSLNMAPRIAKGKVIVGVSGGDGPARMFFDAYDAQTGKRAWRFYTTPGDPAQPFENPELKKAAETWDGEWWKQGGGGGSVWDGMSYDADAGLVYVGTGNAQPWAQQHRTHTLKDNLYACSILAVDVDTGRLKWYYQVVPGDVWDFDSTQQLTLADLTINGRPRKVITQASKNGFFYVIDRLTGEFISAEPFSKVTWAKGVDPKTGRPMVNPEAQYGLDPIRTFPGGGGAHNAAPTAYNPVAGLMYIPASTNNSFVYAVDPNFKPSPRGGGQFGIARGGQTQRTPPAIGPEPVEGPGGGALVAWDPVAQKMRWRQPGGGSIGGGAMTTAGNLVFQTLGDGRLVAFTADKGDKVLDLPTGVRGGSGPPITFAVNGKQYIALMAGSGVEAGARNPAPPIGPKLLVYTLDGTATLTNPPPAPPASSR